MSQDPEFPSASPPPAATEAKGDDALRSLNAVQRLLAQAMARGSDRDVVSAFAEALAVCEDVEVRGYVETVHGRFQLEVALAGSDASAGPASIRSDGLADDSVLLRLTNADIERLRFRSGDDVLLARVGDPESVSWLIAFSGAIPAPREARLLVYVDLLDQALRTVTTQASSRVSWAILEHLLPSGDRVEPAVEAALAALNDSVGGAGAALIVTMVTGMHVLSLGNAEVFSVQRPPGEADEIVATSRILDRYSMTLAVRRLDDRPFTRRERHLLDVATPIFVKWLSGVLQQPAFAKDRRVASRGFDEVIERLAARAVEEGSVLSVVLFKLGEGAVRPQAIRRWIADIRGQLRPADLAGLVSENEVAVCLTDAGPEHAVSVVERLRRQLATNEQFAGLAPTAVGIASAGAERGSGGSVLHAARESAARHQLA